MEIINIFENKLFSFHYGNEEQNELDKLLSLWNNVEYLYNFVKENKTDIPKDTTITKLVNQLTENANDIDDILYEISNDPNRNLEEFFKPLNNQEYKYVELSKQKGRKNYLRIYAIKIDYNCFVITGGAIKFHHLNKDREHTQIEMQKIDKCRDYLKANYVMDADSFFELLIEQQ